MFDILSSELLFGPGGMTRLSVMVKLGSRETIFLFILS